MQLLKSSWNERRHAKMEQTGGRHCLENQVYALDKGLLLSPNAGIVPS
jgi:hypothetical protein